MNNKKIIFIFSFIIFGSILHIPAKAYNSSAKAAIVYESKTGQILHGENIREKLPEASTTKIMTTLLLLEHGKLDEEFTVDSDAIKVEGSSMGLVENDIVTPYALAAGMMLPSGNDAANAAAVYLAGSIENFSKMMNKRAALIGMKDTNFVTPSGLHDDNHYTTAYDMALLTAAALKNDTFREICSSSEKKVRFGNPPYERYLYNSNKLLKMRDDIIGVKTGFTDEAGRCLVSACERNNITLICVTLNDRNDWNDHLNLYDECFSHITPLYIDAGKIPQMTVGDYGEKTVYLSQHESVIYPVFDGKTPEITLKIIKKPFLYDSTKSGDKAGKVQIYANGKLFEERDLYVE